VKLKNNKIQKKDWDEFKYMGLLWFVNRMLHIFGWVIVFEIDKDNSISAVYPARTIYRGFNKDIEKEGFNKITKYLEDNYKQ